jgi:hypothetical protein
VMAENLTCAEADYLVREVWTASLPDGDGATLRILAHAPAKAYVTDKGGSGWRVLGSGVAALLTMGDSKDVRLGLVSLSTGGWPSSVLLNEPLCEEMRYRIDTNMRYFHHFFIGRNSAGLHFAQVDEGNTFYDVLHFSMDGVVAKKAAERARQASISCRPKTVAAGGMAMAAPAASSAELVPTKPTATGAAEELTRVRSGTVPASLLRKHASAARAFAKRLPETLEEGDSSSHNVSATPQDLAAGSPGKRAGALALPPPSSPAGPRGGSIANGSIRQTQSLLEPRPDDAAQPRTPSGGQLVAAITEELRRAADASPYCSPLPVRKLGLTKTEDFMRSTPNLTALTSPLPATVKAGRVSSSLQLPPPLPPPPLPPPPCSPSGSVTDLTVGRSPLSSCSSMSDIYGLESPSLPQLRQPQRFALHIPESPVCGSNVVASDAPSTPSPASMRRTASVHVRKSASGLSPRPPPPAPPKHADVIRAQSSPFLGRHPCSLLKE